MKFSAQLNILILTLVVCTNGLPLLESAEDSIETSTLRVNDSHPKNLYSVKVVVYEVGVLTEIDSNETEDLEPQTHERIDLTFFDDHRNESHLDLGTIPLPVQTNVTGQVLTGIAPIGYSDPNDILSSLPIKGTIVNITHSDTSYFQLTKSNHSQELENFNSESIASVGDVFPEAKHQPEEATELYQ
ncbi:hypothetical protein ACFFRR_011593 [Megaselia abdita]